MHRFYVSSQNISADKILISDKEQVHHIKDVLRLKKKEQAAVFDDKGIEYIAEIENISPQAVNLLIKDKHIIDTAGRIKLTIACAIPKKAKMEDIIDKLTQLGVDAIIPIKTERTIVKTDKQKEVRLFERWKKIALSASEQSQRNTLPLINEIKDIREVLSQARDFELKLIPTLAGKRKPLQETLIGAKPKNILVLIGPEGDFTDEEVDLAVKCGCVPVTLGDSVLRVDTAAVAVTSFIKLYADS
jgi:16S rRNA (uracil1498-N3)-methyltransferase